MTYHRLPKYVQRVFDPFLQLFETNSFEGMCKQLKQSFEISHPKPFDIPEELKYLFTMSSENRVNHWKSLLQIISIGTVCLFVLQTH